MEINLIIGLSTLAIIKAAPLVFGALCGLLGERSGVINIGIEGMMLISAFTTFLGSALFNQWTGGIFPTNLSLLVGLFCGITSGALIAALHAVLSIHYKIDQVISGTVINLLAVGLTNYIANVYIDPTHLSGVGVFPTIPIPILSDIPIIGPILFSHQPMIYLMFIMVIFMQYLVFHTPMGLRMRSVGEHPRSADTVGIDVNKTRYVNVILGGVFAGLGGAIMVLESVGRFQKLMTSGRGFIALAALIFGGWTSTGALGSALLFGFSEALGVRLQFGDLNHVKVIVIVSGLVILGLGIFLLIKKIIEKEINIKKYIFISILIVLGSIIMIGSNYVKFPTFSIPIEFLGLLPYLLTIFVLAGFVRRAKGPAAAGIPYEKQ